MALREMVVAQVLVPVEGQDLEDQGPVSKLMAQVGLLVSQVAGDAVVEAAVGQVEMAMEVGAMTAAARQREAWFPGGPTSLT